ncbi:Riboflavin biosynthesis protein RibF (Includes: Riboflavin kinase; FMN adenylyltransferase) (fragment) [Cupriavidus taiwanensis]|uniref:Bifunctional riboflavin kinase/FMN adenylyltransferase n=1 Tax=Cupriavidus taiwanensis TaxID=164546 RepID=A0A375CQ85_9BURK
MKIVRTLPILPDGPSALTIGNFDGVHRGHQAMLARLKAAAKLRGIPACVLTFEPHPREFLFPNNAPRRLTTFAEKTDLLKRYGMDRVYVCPFDTETANIPAAQFVSQVLVGMLGLKWLLVGEDFRFGGRRLGDVALLSRLGQEMGFELETQPSVLAHGERISSTAVRTARAQGDLKRMEFLLGRSYLPRENVVKWVV